MVEYPVTDLETDLAQIALGYPSSPNYRAASYVQNLAAEQPIQHIYDHINDYYYDIYKRTSKSSELNTLGYVYLRSGRIDEALLAFYLNMNIFHYQPNVYDSYGEALSIKGDTASAVWCYEKVLELDSGNTNALEQLALLKTSE